MKRLMIVSAVLTAFAAQADLKLGTPFADGMVLQEQVGQVLVLLLVVADLLLFLAILIAMALIALVRTKVQVIPLKFFIKARVLNTPLHLLTR